MVDKGWQKLFLQFGVSNSPEVEQLRIVVWILNIFWSQSLIIDLRFRVFISNYESQTYKKHAKNKVRRDRSGEKMREKPGRRAGWTEVGLGCEWITRVGEATFHSHAPVWRPHTCFLSWKTLHTDDDLDGTYVWHTGYLTVANKLVTSLNFFKTTRQCLFLPNLPLPPPLFCAKKQQWGGGRGKEFHWSVVVDLNPLRTGAPRCRRQACTSMCSGCTLNAFTAIHQASWDAEYVEAIPQKYNTQEWTVRDDSVYFPKRGAHP